MYDEDDDVLCGPPDGRFATTNDGGVASPRMMAVWTDQALFAESGMIEGGVYEAPGECTSSSGDINSDGFVNVQDLISVILHWNETCPPPPPDCPWDVTGDGVVNVSDMIQVIVNWTP